VDVSSVTVQNGSVLVNSNYLKFSGGITVSTNSLFINAGAVDVPGVSSLDETLTIANGGTFRDDGAGSITVSKLLINPGGTFIPGGFGIGTTTVRGNGVGTSSGRVIFGIGSTNIFKVNPAAGTSTILYSGGGFQDFGPAMGTPQYIGGTILITNLNGVEAYTNGQEFRLFGNADTLSRNIESTGAATNAYPILQPAPPKPGLTWDLRNLRYLDAGGQNGIIRVVAVATNPTNFTTFSTASYFGVVITNVTTNDFFVTTIEWPSNHTGWRLLQQKSTLTQGLRPGSANWNEVFFGRWTNLMVLTNTYSTNVAQFYWMVYP
jgi:hypothetical protein